MNELDDRLAIALQRRADTADGLVVSPLAVRHAVHRQRARARRLTATLLIAAALPAAGFALGQRQHATRAATRPAAPVPAGATAAVPWSGNINLTLRSADTGGAHRGWELCFGESCADVAAPGQHSVSLIGQATTVQGLAPLGTARVTVTTLDSVSVDAQLGTPVGPHPPGVLFGAPGVVVSRPEGSAFSLTYRVTAFDAAGVQLAVRTSVGGWDLARQHPATGHVRVIDEPQGTGPSVVAWSDQAGWVCWGERSGSGAAAIFGAYSCTPPAKPDSIALVDDDVGDGFLLLRLPGTVTTLEVRDAAGHPTATASLHAVGEWSFAEMDRRAAGSSPGSTVTALDRSGRVVLQVPTGGLQQLDGTISSDG